MGALQKCGAPDYDKKFLNHAVNFAEPLSLP